MKLKPLYNAVVVVPYEIDKEESSLITVPSLGENKSIVGKVIGVGEGWVIPGVGFEPTKLKEGEIVILPTMGFTKFTFENEEYFIGPENQVLSIVDLNE